MTDDDTSESLALITTDESEEHNDYWQKRTRQLLSMAWLERPSALFISISIFLYTTTSVGEPTRQVLRFKLACNSLVDEDGICDKLDSHLMVSNYNQYSLILSQLAAVLALSSLGTLSDKYGRRLFIILITTVVLISRILLYLVIVKTQTFHQTVFLCIDFFANCMGGILGMLGLANSYISDIIEPKKRSYYMGFITGAMFMGEVVGPLLSNILQGYFKTEYDPKAYRTFSPLSYLEISIMKVEIIVFILLLVFDMLVLPESKTIEEPEPPNFAVKRLLNVFSSLQPLASVRTARVLIWVLVAVNCIMTMYGMAVGEIVLQYSVYKFEWKSNEVGALMGILAFSRVVVLFGVSPYISKLLTKKFLKSSSVFDSVDCIMLLIGLTLDMLGYIGLSAAKSSSQFISAVIMGCFGPIIQPTLQSVILKYYPQSKTAEVIMSLSLMGGITGILSPFCFMSIYNFGITHHIAQLVFFVCVAINFTLIVAILLVKRFTSLQMNQRNHSQG